MSSTLPDVVDATRTAASADAGTPAGTVVLRAAGLRVRGGMVTAAGDAAPAAGELAVFCRPVVTAPAVQDIAQEALIAAWENLARFRAGSSFSTWLYQIVTRRALNKVTRGRGADLVDLLEEAADPIAGPAAQAERNLAAGAVTDALAALPFAQRGRRPAPLRGAVLR